MAKKKQKRRRSKPTAQTGRMEQFASDVLSAIISGLITAAILKMLDW